MVNKIKIFLEILDLRKSELELYIEYNSKVKNEEFFIFFDQRKSLTYNLLNSIDFVLSISIKKMRVEYNDR